LPGAGPSSPEISRKLRSQRMRRYSEPCASRFVWRLDMEGFMHTKHGRSFPRFMSLALRSVFRPDVAWDAKGRRLLRSAFGQVLAASARRLRFPQKSAVGPNSMTGDWLKRERLSRVSRQNPISFTFSDTKLYGPTLQLPPSAELMTRCTSTTLTTPSPLMSAETASCGLRPRAALTDS
jgi:hypothetical protein